MCKGCDKGATAKDILIVLFAANIPTLGLLLLSGYFAYLDNGYWGWPFAISLFVMSGIKSPKERFEEDRDIRLKKVEDEKKYGKIYDN